MRLPTGAELWPIAIFTVIFLILVNLMHWRQRWTAHYPPGPMPWPVLGNLLHMDFQNMPAGFQKVREFLEDRRSHGDHKWVVVKLHAGQGAAPPPERRLRGSPVRRVVQDPRSRWIFQRQQLGGGMDPSSQFEMQLTGW